VGLLVVDAREEEGACVLSSFDGTVVGAGEDVGASVIGSSFSVGLVVLPVSGDVGARVLSLIPKSEGDGVGSSEDIGSIAMCSPFSVGLLVVDGGDIGDCVSSIFDGIVVTSGESVGIWVTRFTTVGLVVLAIAGDAAGVLVFGSKMKFVGMCVANEGIGVSAGVEYSVG
jgi:hypothetical protein